MTVHYFSLNPKVTETYKYINNQKLNDYIFKIKEKQAALSAGNRTVCNLSIRPS